MTFGTREFEIPLDKDDLLVVRANAYTVKTIEPVASLTKSIDATRVSFQNHGPEFITETFDTFFSVLVHGNKVEFNVTLRAFDRIHKAIDRFIEDMEPLFENRAEINAELKPKYRNINKMYAYLFSSLASSIEDYVVKNSNDTANIGKRKKASQKSDIEADWEPRRQKALELIYRWLQLPIHKFWTPPFVEDLFTSNLAQFCYKVLENSRDAKSKHVRETIFEILGTLVKRYNQGITCVMRIIQLVQLYDALAVPLAGGVIHMVEKTDCKSFITEIIHEIGRNEPGEAEVRNTAAFLEAVASSKPEFVLPIIDDITKHLESECYAMRNCVIGVLGAVVLGSLTDRDISEEKRRERDRCLHHLNEHILDDNAYVRSKVLQVWQRLCCDGAVPVRLQVTLIHAVTERLHDKAAQVRKQALQLLRTLVQCNPFAAKLNREDFSKQLEQGRTKLKELKVSVVSLSTRGDVDRFELWNSLLPEIRRAIVDVLTKETEDDSSSSEDEDEEPEERREVDMDQEFETIRHLLLTEEVTEAVNRLLLIFRRLPDSSDMHRMKQDDKVNCLLACLQKIFEESEARPSPDEPTAADTDAASRAAKDKDHEARVRDLKKCKKELAATRNLVNYIENSLNFAMELEGAIPLAESLLFVATPSVAIEACTFLGTAAQFGVPSALSGVRKALLQVANPEPSVRNNVASVYKDIYLTKTDANQSSRQKALTSVKGLVELLQGMNEDGQSRALGQLVGTWLTNKDLGPEELQVMWERFSMKILDTSPIESRAALILLTMAGAHEPALLIGNLAVLIKVGLGPRAREDLLLARDTCRALRKIRRDPEDPLKPALRYPNDHGMFREIVDLLTEGFANTKKAGYLSFAIDALDAVYHLANNPGLLAKEVLCAVLEKSNLMRPADAISEEIAEATQGRRHLDRRSQDSSSAPTENGETNIYALTKLLHLVGHIAIRELVHLDNVVYKELKRRNTLREMKKGNKTLQGPVSTPASAQRTLRNMEAHNISTLNEESNEEVLVGATADDADADFITNALETDIVTGSGLLAQFVPLVLDVCRHPEKYNDQTLQISGVLALNKMMTVSSGFCSEHLQLLVTIMERSPYPTVRANVLIGLSDLVGRFPNKIEPWTSHLYGRLRDDDVHVRRTCVIVLANLIMREMIRVKGQVSSLALCIVDADETIRENTRQFFRVLSQKGNALYNVMPDILSHLMDPEVNLEEKDFQEIIKYVLGLQQKERQTETIIDKLCSRLKLATMERQWRDLAYCLSLLTFNPKSLRMLINSLPQLTAKIHDAHVMKYLQMIIETSKKKPEAKATCLELEQKIEKMLENPEAGEGDVDDRVAMPPPPVPKRTKKTRQATRRDSSSDDDNDEDDEEGDDSSERENAPPKNAKQRATPRSSAKKNKPSRVAATTPTPRSRRNRLLEAESPSASEASTPRRSARSKRRL